VSQTKSLAVSASLLWSGGCALFVLANLVCAPFVDPSPGPAPDLSAFDPRALERTYPGMARTDVEALLRETWTRQLAFEPYTQFRERPFRGRYVNVDAAGFRVSVGQGPWPADAQALNVFVFGGSTAFGYGVRDQDTFASHLASGLSALGRERPARVYNFGRGAYYSTQERVLFDQLLQEGAPPAVALFLDGLNEFFYPRDEPAHSARLRAAFEEDAAGLLPALRRAARALPVLRLLAKHPARGDEDEEGAEGSGGGFGAGVERVVARYVANKRLITAAAREHGVTAVFVWQPIPMYAYEHRDADGPRPGLGSEARWRRRYESVLARMQRGDLGPEFIWCADVARGAEGPLYVDRVHYSAAMNRRIAEAVLGAMVERRLLPAS
jgi:lysophospholipase L1-like esterase